MAEWAGVPAFPGKPLAQLLDGLLGRAIEDVPGALGGAISVGHREAPLTVLAASGLDETFVDVQLRGGGPVPDAARGDDPVVTADVFADPRWPGLTRDTVQPSSRDGWGRVRGVVAVPGRWSHSGVLVLSVVLDRPATGDVIATLGRYEPLVGTALVVADAGSGLDDMWQILRSRAALEQAKGAIMAVRRCDEEEAWETLRRGSQDLNVKVRELAVALVEQLGHTPVKAAAGLPPIKPGVGARRAAEQFWAALALRQDDVG
ncbi:ANTAR domain-containing protein [Amycolatopsis sp. NPDC051045]|uniref:ANTAR domain-containing protein n=1 Tax=Amycolatopsis sp. NPDC051045 TaxID=3156922 RepID=UPI003447398A